jgi:hypothetical protein
MNRALLADLQQRRGYPCVTVLLTTHPGAALADGDELTARRLLVEADRRLTGDVADAERMRVVGALEDLLVERRDQPVSAALGLFASVDHAAAVVLGAPVVDRVVIDDTFATRDLVADLARTALFRVVTVSDRRVRLLVGDRGRLVEERTDRWPLERADDVTSVAWSRELASRLQAEVRERPMPTVLAGVEHTVRATVGLDLVDAIGVVPGNHDRTGWADLHAAAWPLVATWLRADRREAMRLLDQARSERRFAGGIDEVWPLATTGRIDVLVVEEHYAVAARIAAHDQLEPADDPEAPDVVDDVVDDAIETVLRFGGRAVIVPDGDLDAHDRIAAVLRY